MPKLAGEAFAPAALLLAEVERLKRELDEARARIAELELHADIDPLLDIFNRRGFERELKRSLAYVKRYGTAGRADLSSTSTASRRSTTSTATPPATRCSRRWRASSPPMCAPPTWWRGSAATNSPC